MIKVSPDALFVKPYPNFYNSDVANPLSAELFELPLSRMFSQSLRQYG